MPGPGCPVPVARCQLPGNGCPVTVHRSRCLGHEEQVANDRSPAASRVDCSRSLACDLGGAQFGKAFAARLRPPVRPGGEGRRVKDPLTAPRRLVDKGVTRGKSAARGEANRPRFPASATSLCEASSLGDFPPASSSHSPSECPRLLTHHRPTRRGLACGTPVPAGCRIREWNAGQGGVWRCGLQSWPLGSRGASRSRSRRGIPTWPGRDRQPRRGRAWSGPTPGPAGRSGIGRERKLPATTNWRSASFPLRDCRRSPTPR